MFSFLTPSRTVLMISDDALFVYSISGRGGKMIEAVPWSAENFEENVALIISKDCGGKPVLILNDMVEQHYRKEKIPNVGVLDKQSVVKRKLEVAFPNYPVRAALPLKEKIAKTDKSMAASVYIFVAVPASEAFTKTMNAAMRSLAPIVGFYLLPVESSDMIKKLAEKIVAKTERKAKWTVFIGQHHSGGLRQIVVKDGELALTRMTPIVETDDDPSLWANEVHQEFQATMSYLSRFGFDLNDGLNVVLVAEATAGDIVSELVDTQCNFYSVTSDEAARFLKLPEPYQETSFHADVLHASWAGKKGKFILPMKAQQIDSVSKPRKITTFVSLLLFLSAAFFSYQLFGYFQSLSTVSADIESAERRKSRLTLQLEKEIQRKKDLGFDIKLIQVSLGVHDRLDARQVDVLGLFYNIGLSLGRDLRIDRLELVRGRFGLLNDFIKKDSSASPLFSVKIFMTFPSKTDAQKGNQEVRDLRERLQRLLPDHVIEVTKFLEDYEYSEELLFEDRDDLAKSPAQDYIAEILIEGPAEK